MATQVIMPQLGESVVEGTLTKWLKNPGDTVEQYEPLVEVNTDKVDTEVPSPAGGVLLEVVVPAGTVVQAGALLAWIGGPGEELAGSPGERLAGGPGEKPAAGGEETDGKSVPPSSQAQK